jgi:hypothetical protein
MWDPKKFQRLGQTDDPRLTERLDADPILIMRLDMLQQKLCRIGEWFESDLRNLRVRHELKDKLRGHLRVEVGKQLVALNKVYRQLRNTSLDDAVVLQVAWQSYKQIDQESNEKIFGECLEAIGGLAIRDKKLSARTSWVADTADEFIRECAKEYVGQQWLSFAVFARQEALNRTMARIVRLRFPEWTVWSLPLAAHEFGHVVIEDNTEWMNFAHEQAKSLSWLTGRDDEQRLCMYEILADAFATYTMGPAYVCAAISLWLNPLPLSNESSDMRCVSGTIRARLIFRIIEQLRHSRSEGAADGEPSQPHVFMQEKLERKWREVIERVESSDEGAEGSEEVYLSEEQVTSLVDEILERFSWALKPKGAYLYQGAGGFEEAERWADGWLQQLDNGERLAIPRVSADSTLRNALNAAWLCRVQSQPYQFDVIADAAYELCKKIIRRRRIDTDEPDGEGPLGPYIGRPPKQ